MDAEQKKQTLAVLLKWAGAIGAAAILAPVVFLALKATLGLLALGAAAAVGLAAIRLAPVVSFKLSNVVVRLIVAEARTNPIETMHTLLAEKTEELARADAAIVDFETEVRDYDDRARDFAKRFPDEAEDFNAIGEQMRAALTDQKTQQKEARAGLKDFASRIERAEAIYAMSLAAQRVTELSGTAQSRVFAEIKQKVAFDSVRSNLNKSFAALSMAVARRDAIAVANPRLLETAK